MVTVMRQRSFHKPNGSSLSVKKAKGCFGEQLKIFTDIRPYRVKGKYKTKSMRQIYAEMPRKAIARNGNQARKLRRRLANMKMPMPVGRGANPKKDRSARRPRCVVWPSEKNPSPRYKRDGSIRK